MTRPAIAGSPVLFDTTPGTVTVTKTVAAGEWVGLYFACGNNNPANLTITDSLGGTNAQWLSTTNALNNTATGWRYRFMASAGTLVATIGKDGSAFYTGICVGYSGVNPAVFDGGAVVNTFTASPSTVTPSNASGSDTLCIAGWSGTDARFAAGFTQSDTALSSNDNATVTRQARLQTRNAVAGAQAAMTFAFGAGGSGSDFRGATSVINLFGVPPAATLSSFSVASFSDVQVIGRITTDQGSGTVYFAVTPTNVAPTAAQIIAGTGGGIIAAGNVVAASGVNSAPINGLTNSTTYYLWATQNNGTSNSTVAGSVSFTTTAPAPTIASASNMNPADGSSVTLVVANAGTPTGTVVFGGVPQTVTAWNNTSVTFTAASSTNRYNVALGLVITSGATGIASSSFTGMTMAPPAGWAALTVGTLNPTASLRITAAGDLTSGDQLAYDTKSGTVAVSADMTFSAATSVASFNAKAWALAYGVWGATGLQTIN